MTSRENEESLSSFPECDSSVPPSAPSKIHIRFGFSTKTNQPSKSKQLSGTADDMASPERQVALSDQEPAGFFVMVSVLPFPSKEYCPGSRTNPFFNAAALI